MAAPALGTVVPIVAYCVIDHPTAKWKTVMRGPETPLIQAKARAAAGPGAMLWIREPGERPRPV